MHTTVPMHRASSPWRSVGETWLPESSESQQFSEDELAPLLLVGCEREGEEGGGKQGWREEGEWRNEMTGTLNCYLLESSFSRQKEKLE